MNPERTMTDRQGAVDALIDEFHDRRWNHDGDCTAKQWMREFAEALATLASAPDERPRDPEMNYEQRDAMLAVVQRQYEGPRLSSKEPTE